MRSAGVVRVIKLPFSRREQSHDGILIGVSKARLDDLVAIGTDRVAFCVH